MEMPTREQGHAAHLRGQDDGIGGIPPHAGPWDPDSAESVERTLAICYRRGYNYGRQIRLQRKYGDAPTPPTD